MESDYLACQEIFRRYSRTYYYSSHFFPRSIRTHVCALYAFFRLPDEIVDDMDGTGKLACRERELTRFREDFERAWAAGASSHAVLRAYCATAQQFGIPKSWPDAFLESMTMDLSVARYETFGDLRRYVYGSAEVVGLMMAKVLGVPDEGLAAARELGLAMQLTNFYRDIGEDWDRGRIYVPLEDLERFAIREADWNSSISPEKFSALMRFQTDRNWEQYRRAHLGLPLIPRQSRLAVALSSTGYQRTLQCIVQEPMIVWRQRVSKGRGDYLPILFKAWNAAYVQ